MSLINQALRKAQHQRTPNRPATAADHANASPSPSYNTANTSKPGLLIGLVAGIALLIGLVAGLTIVLLRSEPAPAIQQAASSAIAPVAPAVSPPALQPLSPALQATPPAQLVEQNRPSVLEELRTARQAAEAKAAAEAGAAKQAAAAALAAKQAAEAKAAAKPSQDIIQWLAKSKISGVRLSGSASKVILNNKAYSVGDTVNASLGLKVLIVQEKRILFIDSNGKKYLKQVI
jgi:rRNA maturation endonuclease Nob1